MKREKRKEIRGESRVTISLFVLLVLGINDRPSRSQTSALPTELFALALTFFMINKNLKKNNKMVNG